MQRYVKDDEWGGSMSAWREMFLFLLFLHADALAFIFFGTSFGLPEFFFLGVLRALAFVQNVLLSALVSRLSPLLLPSWFRGDVLGRMGRRRCD